MFAQANSLAVAVINDELALTTNADIKFTRQVIQGERVIAKATIKDKEKMKRTIVKVESFVDNEIVFSGVFEMFRSNQEKEGNKHENRN